MKRDLADSMPVPRPTDGDDATRRPADGTTTDTLGSTSDAATAAMDFGSGNCASVAVCAGSDGTVRATGVAAAPF